MGLLPCQQSVHLSNDYHTMIALNAVSMLSQNLCHHFGIYSGMVATTTTTVTVVLTNQVANGSLV